MHEATRDLIRSVPSTRNVPTIARIEVVTARDCHLCEDALDTLGSIRQLWPLDVREIPDDSPEGRDLLSTWRPALQPMVLVDGRLFSVGRLPRRKLARLLERRMGAA